MHIESLFLNTYRPEHPIKGHVTVEHDGAKIEVQFTEKECEAIQDIAVNAWKRKQHQIAEALASNTPAVPALAPPDDGIEDAEFHPIDDEIPF